MKMKSFSHRDEFYPTPPPYYSPDDKARNQVKIYHIHSPLRCSPATPTPHSCSIDIPPEETCPTYLPLQVYVTPVVTPIPKFVSHESDLCRSPALTSCPSCQAQVTTRVRYRVGTYSWIVCVVFVLCGLILGCCLLPFLLNHFKDAHHSCPRCHRLLHVHFKTCYQ